MLHKTEIYYVAFPIRHYKCYIIYYICSFGREYLYFFISSFESIPEWTVSQIGRNELVRHLYILYNFWHPFIFSSIEKLIALSQQNWLVLRMAFQNFLRCCDSCSLLLKPVCSSQWSEGRGKVWYEVIIRTFMFLVSIVTQSKGCSSVTILRGVILLPCKCSNVCRLVWWAKFCSATLDMT